MLPDLSQLNVLELCNRLLPEFYWRWSYTQGSTAVASVADGYFIVTKTGDSDLVTVTRTEGEGDDPRYLVRGPFHELRDLTEELLEWMLFASHR